MAEMTREEVIAAVAEGEPLIGRELRAADLRGAYLRGADLRGANLRWANLSGAYLRGADLRGADLRWANLSWANLSGANLSGANLRGADLRGADLSEANLRGADLSGANGLIWLGSRSDQYDFFAQIGPQRRLIIKAGCRYFAVPDAKYHWGRPDYRDKNLATESLKFVAAAEQWFANQSASEIATNGVEA